MLKRRRRTHAARRVARGFSRGGRESYAGRRVAGAAMIFALLVSAGCGQKRITIADTFPPGAYASPWELENGVWSGSFEQAASGLGEDAEAWRRFNPQRVWLALYRHDTRREQRLTVRAFAFASADEAQQAYEHFRPAAAKELRAGDAGCWLEDGVLVRWGRMVLEIFGGSPGAGSAEQAFYLFAFIEKRMPPGLPDTAQ